ncbi:MAG TPA: M15 family metallopeptidase [Pyrinomonadaceae bacterium]|nr:M15 family metallopeptidase [Pyrinomonadaceae bacterium]
MSTTTSSVLPITFVPAPSLEEVRNGTAVLQKGHKGSAVSHVQQLLRISVDQKFGRDTETAVRDFQQRNPASAEPGMEGKVNRALLAAIEAAAAAQPQVQFDFDKRRRLDKVHPKLKEKVTQLAARLAARNMSFLVTDGMRTFAEQDELFKQGRTKPGKIVTKSRGGESNHNYGLAIDSYPVIDGRVFTDIPDGATQQFRKTFNAIQQAIGEEGEAVGLTWGGRWTSMFDPPHLQLFPLNDMKPSKCLDIFRSNGNSLAAVWAEVDRRFS